MTSKVDHITLEEVLSLVVDRWIMILIGLSKAKLCNLSLDPLPRLKFKKSRDNLYTKFHPMSYIGKLDNRFLRFLSLCGHKIIW